MSGTVVILLGAPGAGKGTQAARLSAELGLPHVSTGDLFRENLAGETTLGKRAKEFMENGRLVPDEFVVDMLFDRVSRSDCEKGYLLDGFPRTLPQATILDGRLEGASSVIVIDIEVADEFIVERITGRLTCKNGHVQHRTFSAPKTEGVCDTCGEGFTQRGDDSADIVRKRLAVYHEQTAPVADHYRVQGVLCEVDGQRSTDEVFEACKGCLGAEA